MVNGEVASLLMFPWEETNCDESHKKTGWRVGDVRYEIYQATLKKIEAHMVVPHMLSIKHKIEWMMEKEDHFRPLLFQVFLRTLKYFLSEQWN
jgi:hypothetical protein